MAAKKVKFKRWNCTLHFSNYMQNGRTAIELTSRGEIIAVATVNLNEVQLGPDEVIIKSHFENEGMYEALLDAGIISEVKRFVETDLVKFYICDLIK